MKYKGLNIPSLNKVDYIDGPIGCGGGHSGKFTAGSYKKVCRGINECRTCLASAPENLETYIEYLIKEGYITKEQALTHALSGGSRDE